MSKILNKKLLATLLLVLIFAFSKNTIAQVDYSPIFTTLRLEARADVDYNAIESNLADTVQHLYGFNGRYFNLHIGGNLGDKFSYYFRQRIIADNGSHSLFDNTDFLYINFNPNPQWTIRIGKDALAVGGFEYDAPPIDVLYSTTYWDNFYCFQLGASVVYRTSDGRNALSLQLSNSPYIHTGGSPWNSGLFSYSLFWSGTFGHFRTLYSVNMFEHTRGSFLGYIALGHKLVYDRWDIYLDLLHHSVSIDDWGRNFGIVSCFNFLVTPDINIFAKAAYEQNKSKADIAQYTTTNTSLDCLVTAGSSYALYGLGIEWRPSFYKDVRLHGFVACRQNRIDDAVSASGKKETHSTINANIGITWNMDVHKMLKDRLRKDKDKDKILPID